jgi:hypothetical protein
LLCEFGFVARGTVCIDGLFGEIVGATAGDTENAPTVPADVRVSVKQWDAGGSKR